MTRLVELGTIGGVIAVAWIAAAWAAGEGERLSLGGWVLVAAALVVTYGAAVEGCVRVWAAADAARERNQDGRTRDEANHGE